MRFDCWSGWGESRNTCYHQNPRMLILILVMVFRSLTTPRRISANRDQGDLTLNRINCGTCGSRVEPRPAIDQKSISMVPMGQCDLQIPPSLHSAAHRVRCGTPIVKISDQINARSRWIRAKEVHRLCHRPPLPKQLRHSIHAGPLYVACTSRPTCFNALMARVASR